MFGLLGEGGLREGKLEMLLFTTPNCRCTICETKQYWGIYVSFESLKYTENTFKEDQMIIQMMVTFTNYYQVDNLSTKTPTFPQKHQNHVYIKEWCMSHRLKKHTHTRQKSSGWNVLFSSSKTRQLQKNGISFVSWKRYHQDTSRATRAHEALFPPKIRRLCTTLIT